MGVDEMTKRENLGRKGRKGRKVVAGAVVREVYGVRFRKETDRTALSIQAEQ